MKNWFTIGPLLIHAKRSRERCTGGDLDQLDQWAAVLIKNTDDTARIGQIEKSIYEKTIKKPRKQPGMRTARSPTLRRSVLTIAIGIFQSTFITDRS